MKSNLPLFGPSQMSYDQSFFKGTCHTSTLELSVFKRPTWMEETKQLRRVLMGPYGQASLFFLWLFKIKKGDSSNCVVAIAIMAPRKWAHRCSTIVLLPSSNQIPIQLRHLKIKPIFQTTLHIVKPLFQTLKITAVSSCFRKPSEESSWCGIGLTLDMEVRVLSSPRFSVALRR